MNNEELSGNRTLLLSFLVAVSLIGAAVIFTGAAAAADAGPGAAENNNPANITAGATNQAPYDGSGIATFNFSENSNSEFAQQGTVSLTIPQSSSVRFDQGNTSFAASIEGSGTTAATGTNATIDSGPSFVSDRKVELSVSGLEPDQNENVTISGLRFSAPTDATDTSLTFSYGASSASFTLGVERLNAEVSSTNIVRGADQTGPANISIEARDTATIDSTGDGDALNTTGLHAADENISVSIPTDMQDKVDFDQSTTPVLAGDESTFGGSVGDGEFTSPHSFTFSVTGEDINGDEGDEIEFKNVQFNVTGETNSSVDPSFDLELNVTATPVDAVGSVETQTLSSGNTITATAPTVRIADGAADLQIGPGNNGVGAGTSDVDMSQTAGGTVQVIDSGTGGEISTNGDVIVEIPNNIGVTFDQRQSIAVEETQGGDNEANALTNGTPELSDRQITIPIDTASNAGDALLIGSSDGTDDDEDVDSLLFNTTTDTSVTNVNLTVTTNGGAADVVQNTSQDPQDHTSTSDLDVVAPTLETNSDGTDGGNGNDLNIANDGDSETQVDPNNNNDIFIESGVNNDIADGSGTNITVSIPSTAGLTFDQSQTPSVQSGTDGDVGDSGSAGVAYVNGTVLNITLSNAADSGGDDVYLTDVRYNTSADTTESVKLNAVINRTGVSFTSENFINTTVVTADDVQADADNSDPGSYPGSSGNTGDGDASAGGITVGSYQESRFYVQNSTGFGDVPLQNYGGADLSLEVTDTPDDGSVSDVSLNTSNPTTNQAGEAPVNVSFSDSASTQGTYNVTASLVSNSSINVTAEYSLTSGDASQFNVTGVDNALIDDSGLGEPAETEVAAYSVRVEDNGGNIVSDTGVDVNINVEGGSIDAVYDDINADGSSGAGSQLLDDDGDGARNYDTGDNGGTEGQFYVFATSSSAGDLDVTVSQESVSDTGTATIYDNVDSVNVQPETLSLTHKYYSRC